MIGLKDLSEKAYEELNETNIWFSVCQRPHNWKIHRWLCNRHTVPTLWKWRYQTYLNSYD
jgi:hypothetical protein